MTIQTQAFTPPEFQPLKICTYKPTSKAKNKYFKLINTYTANHTTATTLTTAANHAYTTIKNT